MGLSILHLHLHGLFRGSDLELGRDSDTGGQTTYVLELVRALASSSLVDRVEVLTRQIFDKRISVDYGQPTELIGSGALIRRIPFGPRRYVRKEHLWPYLDHLADRLCRQLQAQSRLPNWIHAHYADAGYVGSLVARRLGLPLVFTGHSLGREKRRRLLAAGLDSQQIDDQYSLSTRIAAEEQALCQARFVVTSTQHELECQYARYNNFSPELATVISPGVDSALFHPFVASTESGAHPLVGSFLRDPERPPLLAICRADHRKNIPALLEVFARSDQLRDKHNLVLVLGCRHDLRQLEKPPREVLLQLFELIDRYDLYGLVAYPKHHTRDQIPSLYRWAARLGGVFVNPALTEPFGLTLLESAACGLPVVATDDGGPKDILEHCNNGLLADVSDLGALQAAIEQSLSNAKRWQGWRENGLKAVRANYSWSAHVSRYLAMTTRALSPKELVPDHPDPCSSYWRQASSS
jgi:sucrose-phosphate synthase